LKNGEKYKQFLIGKTEVQGKKWYIKVTK